MRIAMLGTRGVPASYSGFETCVEQIGKRLVQRGHQVVVYCRPRRTGAAGRVYEGMRRVTLPDIPTKGLETLSHSLLSTVHSMVGFRPDAAVVFGVGNAIFCPMLIRAGIPTAINVDGADWQRKKWGPIGSRYLRWTERVSRRASAVVADSHAVAKYYERTHAVPTVYIPYGAEVPPSSGTTTLDQFRLTPRGYLLAVGRFVPENGFHNLIEAYADLKPAMPFAVVGDAPYSQPYKKRLRDMAPPGVIFTGYQFGAAYHELSAGAYAYLFGAEVGGSHPVLIEQLAHGNCVLARWTESNEEVMGDAGLYFHDQAELRDRLGLMLSDPSTVAQYRALARRRADRYSWDRVTDDYETLLRRLVDVHSHQMAG